MSHISYETVETLVYDPVAPNRAATRSALHALGFRRVQSASTIEALNTALMHRPPDLAICEIAGFEEPLCEVIQELRQGLKAYNPFIVIIVTAWSKTQALASRVVNSGADDLLLRPYSTQLLESRILSQIERRKGFVVTSDYIGPDRRRHPRPGPVAQLLEPPNTLKIKAMDRSAPEATAERIGRELKAARSHLVSERLSREAFQICVLWRLMQAQGRIRRYEVDLDRLAEAAQNLALRARGTEYEAAIPRCDTLVAAIEGLQHGADRSMSMHVLGTAAMMLNQIFSPHKTVQDNLREIDATVATVRVQALLAS